MDKLALESCKQVTIINNILIVNGDNSKITVPRTNDYNNILFYAIIVISILARFLGQSFSGNSISI